MPQMQIPKFQTEAEEAAWWDSNREAVSAELWQAAQEGRLQRRSERLAQAVSANSLQLSDEELRRADEAARRRGVTTVEYLRLVVHEALEREPAA